MYVPSMAETIRSFIFQQTEYWNAGNKEAFIDLYRNVAPKGLRIEYIGQPVADGWQVLDRMWETYNGLVEVEIGDILVNGNEGACYFRNVLLEDGTVNPTIEIYRFENETLDIRYFYRHHT